MRNGTLGRQLAIGILQFAICHSIAKSAEGGQPTIKIVIATADWCTPCRVAKEHTTPALKKLGYGVREADADKVDVTLWQVTDLPTFILHCDDVEIGRVVGQQVIGRDGRNDTLAQIVAIVDKITPVARSQLAAPGRPSKDQSAEGGQPTRPTRPFDLVARLRGYVGSAKPISHSSVSWQFEEELSIAIGDGVTITRPKLFQAEFDFSADGSLQIVFARPLVAHGSKAGIPGEADISRVVIRGNVVSAPGVPVKVLGLDLFHKDWQIEIKQDPFE